MEKLESAIGGYFELELLSGQEYHVDCVSLNTARNALEYILKTEKFKKVYIPYFTCDVILEPFHKLNIDFEFYKIDENLEPIFDYDIISDNQAFLYTNYFGIKDHFCEIVSKQVKNLIIDNAQAFYSKPIDKAVTFYSPRKFFGVSDGSYLYNVKKLTFDFEQDFSYNRMAHLLKRADITAEDGYQDFAVNDKSLEGESIKIMSKITKKILESIDYDKARKQRIENFNYLHKSLKDQNLLHIAISDNQVPMVYPFWSKKELRSKLLENRVYSAKYWPNVYNWCEKDSLEVQLTDELIHLPIDQRYTKNELDKILNIIKEWK
ncbi:hypothetical protein NZ698_16055 [Chryseobacterium sp. PBS4-4]|uniref:DegT/DnrJ/EryC1/StrS aminotransferase family protein n=1 Tax=Chryseobacterium edaphi TaxID=2976532 RepID=A0ABT2WDM2_9FLAO|nr:hypothetical protein [Chryseobacterium edaphi]MCU7618710.1 hypothetical protein [Chryseobacterium edaphi]